MEETDQIEFWKGEFGAEYRERNAATDERIHNQTFFWAKILEALKKRGAAPASILEIGANVGINLRALRNLTSAELMALEPNDEAREVLKRDSVVSSENVLAGSGQSIPREDRSVELVFTSGVLIHVHPDHLLDVCEEMFRVSSQFIVCAEYFSHSPEAIDYRKHSGKLFKRDFGGFWLDNFPSLKLVDYGFEWMPITGLDNITWWIFEKH